MTPTTGDGQLQCSSMHDESTNDSTVSMVDVDESSTNPESSSMIQQVTQLL